MAKALDYKDVLAVVSLVRNVEEEELVEEAVLARWGDDYLHLATSLQSRNGKPKKQGGKGKYHRRSLEELDAVTVDIIQKCKGHVELNSVWVRKNRGKLYRYRVIGLDDLQARCQLDTGRVTKIRYDMFSVPVEGCHHNYKPMSKDSDKATT